MFHVPDQPFPSRTQAIADGDLVDVTRWAHLFFDTPVACTAALWSIMEKDGGDPTTELVLLAHLLGEVWKAKKAGNLGEKIAFRHRLAGEERQVAAICETGIDGRSAITVMLADEC